MEVDNLEKEQREFEKLAEEQREKYYMAHPYLADLLLPFQIGSLQLESRENVSSTSMVRNV